MNLIALASFGMVFAGLLILAYCRGKRDGVRLWQESLDRLQAEHAKQTGILLRGWTCQATVRVTNGVLRGSRTCQTFNGEEKETLTRCRHCDAPRPEQLRR